MYVLIKCKQSYTTTAIQLDNWDKHLKIKKSDDKWPVRLQTLMRNRFHQWNKIIWQTLMKLHAGRCNRSVRLQLHRPMNKTTFPALNADRVSSIAHHPIPYSDHCKSLKTHTRMFDREKLYRFILNMTTSFGNRKPETLHSNRKVSSLSNYPVSSTSDWKLFNLKFYLTLFQISTLLVVDFICWLITMQ